MVQLKYFYLLILLTVLPLYSQTDSIFSENEKYLFTPQISGGQIEATTLLAVTEIGGLIDVDVFRRNSNQIYTFGLRISLEYYGYLEAGGPTGGGPFTDYCFYARHSANLNDFTFSILGGLAYHTYSSYFEDKLLFRAGIEFKYDLIGKFISLLLKGATSFQKRTAYIGIGISVGYFK
jgi:hypothetical protein